MNDQNTTATVQQQPVPHQVGLFTIEPGLAIWTWVIFAMLFIVLRKYAWGPLMLSINSREQMMFQAVEHARKTKEELENIARRQEEILKNAREEAFRMVENGRKSSEEAARQIALRARDEADLSVARAQELIELQKERALAEIREQAVDMVIRASQKLIETSLDDDGHRRIVEKQLEEL